MSYWDSSALVKLYVQEWDSAAALYGELQADIAVADIVIQPETADVEREFGLILEACFSQLQPVFIRTNDALHLASARIAGEQEFITAD